jgi:hypothetical protein
MKHLTIDEIIDFVSTEKVDCELASKVTTHILRCQTCFNKVRAFQNVHDGLNGIGAVCDINEVFDEDEKTMIEELEAKE